MTAPAAAWVAPLDADDQADRRGLWTERGQPPDADHVRVDNRVAPAFATRYGEIRGPEKLIGTTGGDDINAHVTGRFLRAS